MRPLWRSGRLPISSGSERRTRTCRSHLGVLPELHRSWSGIVAHGPPPRTAFHGGCCLAMFNACTNSPRQSIRVTSAAQPVEQKPAGFFCCGSVLLETVFGGGAHKASADEHKLLRAGALIKH